jgi:hypothetical protein
MYDAHTAERIGVAWLRLALAPASDFGRRTADAAPRFGPGDEAAARARCAQIVALAASLDARRVGSIRAAERRAPDPAPIVSRARVGDPLGDVDFFELGRFVDALDATADEWHAAGGSAADAPPRLASLRSLLAPGRGGGATFHLGDAFGAPLAAARADYAAAAAAFDRERERLVAVLAPQLGFAPDGEEFIVMRDAFAQPLPGTRVVRETPTYWALALVHDGAANAAAVQRDAALAQLGAAEDAVRRDLAESVARDGAAILAAAQALGELDVTLARVKFTQRWGGCVPDFDGARFAFEAASYVPLRERLESAGLPYTPLSLDLRGAAVLSGPNMGGKSAALATCGFIALCCAHGVPPPATSATLPLLGAVAWIGGDNAADREQLLSSFGGEVVRARDALANPARPELFLVDEFARTTGPREGRALLVALVEALAARGAHALVATHFDRIADDAGVPHYAIAGLGERSLDAAPARDVRAALDIVMRAMDYRIVEVTGSGTTASDALALAGLLGLDPAVVARATELFRPRA